MRRYRAAPTRHAVSLSTLLLSSPPALHRAYGTCHFGKVEVLYLYPCAVQPPALLTTIRRYYVRDDDDDTTFTAQFTTNCATICAATVSTTTFTACTLTTPCECLAILAYLRVNAITFRFFVFSFTLMVLALTLQLCCQEFVYLQRTCASRLQLLCYYWWANSYDWGKRHMKSHCRLHGVLLCFTLTPLCVSTLPVALCLPCTLSTQ